MSPSNPSNPPAGASDSSSPLTLHWRFPLTALLLVLAVAAVYFPVRQFEFVNFDDNAYVYENPVVLKGLTWEGVQYAFGFRHWAWHPLAFLSHMLDVELFGTWAGGHHLTNVILHALNAVLVLAVIHQMTGRYWRAAAIAFLFALHPLRVESVAWVCERKDVLSTCLALLSMLTYVRWAQSLRLRWLLATLLLYALSLMSKAMWVTLPAVLLLLDAWPLGRSSLPVAPEASAPPCPRRTLLQLALEKLPLLALSITSVLLTLQCAVQHDAVTSPINLTLRQRVINAVLAYALYLRDTFWPAKLTVLYPHPIEWDALAVAIACAVLAAVLVPAVLRARREPYVLTGLLIFAGMLVPVIGIVQAGPQQRADRFTYGPSLGLTIALVWLLAEHWPGSRRARIALVGLTCTAVLMLTGLSAAQVRTWRNPETLWKHAIAVVPCHGDAHITLGNYLRRRQRLDDAEANYRQAIECDGQRYADAYNNLADVLGERGHWQDSVKLLRTALDISPRDARIKANLGRALMHLGDFQAALLPLLEAEQINPASDFTHLHLGMVLSRLGDLPAAAKHYTESLRLKPDQPEAHNNLGVVLARMGRIDEAAWHFEQAVKLKPDYAEAAANLQRARLQR